MPSPDGRIPSSTHLLRRAGLQQGGKQTASDSSGIRWACLGNQKSKEPLGRFGGDQQSTAVVEVVGKWGMRKFRRVDLGQE